MHTTVNTTAVIAMVATEQQADAIVRELEDTGFPKDAISAIFPDSRTGRDFVRKEHILEPPATTPGTESAGMLGGALGGGLLGGALGWLVGIGALEMTGAGALIAAGPLIAMLGGATLCATVGGLAGALICVGVSEAKVHHYERMIREGGILMLVHTDVDARIRSAKAVLARNGATAIAYTGHSYAVTR
jgi:hypothetical protein